MTEFLPFDELDRDGALRETAEAAADTRGDFLRKAGLGAGAVVAGGAFAGLLPANARGAAIPASDIAILNFALTLEELESAFYADAVAKRRLTGETLRFARVVANHENAHVKFLRRVLGAKAVRKPRFDFKTTTSNQTQFQATAQVLEDAGVHAYLGQVPNIKAKAVLLGAGRILPVEARHAAWIRDIRYSGGNSPSTTPAPASFEDPFSKAKVLALVKSTGFIVG
jgi:Ferritin-like domain